tara:strand:+ start:3514 stop:3954 length:441 start_codon:yes stop_codon:yes gene_type:complete
MQNDKKQDDLKKKNVFQKIKENIDDKEEQLAFISVIVRLVVVAWSGFIVSLNYISIPGYANEPKDITFPASILTGCLSSFGIDAARKRGDGTMKVDKNPQPTFNKADFEKLIEKAAQTVPTQTLRIEQAPIKIVTEASDKDNVSKT